MPRFRRIIEPGELIHVISRFVNREQRLTTREQRSEYLRRLGRALEGTDWALIAYAQMSSHVHLVLVAGQDSFERLMKSIHGPFARWLNDGQGRLGPVFADRPRSLRVHPQFAGQLVAYVHNNPGRAGLVELASESDWTSHRSYIGLDPVPPFLARELGMTLLQLPETRAGFAALDAYVAERRNQPRDPTLTGDVQRARAELRAALGAAVDIAHPRTSPEGLDYEPVLRVSRPPLAIAALVHHVTSARQVSAKQLTSRFRNREIVAVRREVALIGALLGHPCRAIGLHLGVSEAAVRHLQRSATRVEREEAWRVAEALGCATPSPS